MPEKYYTTNDSFFIIIIKTVKTPCKLSICRCPFVLLLALRKIPADFASGHHLEFTCCVATVILNSENWFKKGYVRRLHWRLSRRNQKRFKADATWLSWTGVQDKGKCKFFIQHVLRGSFAYGLRFCCFPVLQRKLSSSKLASKTLKWDIFFTLCQSIYAPWQTSLIE